MCEGITSTKKWKELVKMNNTKMVAVKDVENAVKEVSGGYEMLAVRSASAHPSDWFLMIVLAYSASKGEFVTWLYNGEFNGLSSGHYYYERDNAIENYLTR